MTDTSLTTKCKFIAHCARCHCQIVPIKSCSQSASDCKISIWGGSDCPVNAFWIVVAWQCDKTVEVFFFCHCFGLCACRLFFCLTLQVPLQSVVLAKVFCFISCRTLNRCILFSLNCWCVWSRIKSRTSGLIVKHVFPTTVVANSLQLQCNVTLRRGHAWRKSIWHVVGNHQRSIENKGFTWRQSEKLAIRGSRVIQYPLDMRITVQNCWQSLLEDIISVTFTVTKWQR